MKKLVLVSIMAAMLLTVSVAVMADATNWMFKISASTITSTSSAGDLTIGWFKAYTNGIDASENINPVAPPSGGKNAVAASVFPGTTNDVTMRDFRTPLALDPTLPKIWKIAIYTQGAWNPADNIRVTFKPQASTPFPATDPAFPAGSIVKFTSADYNAIFSVAEFAAKSTTWSFDISATDSTGALYTAENPYYLEVMVPEPSSMVALASGLAGLVGFGIRRRRA